MQELLERVQYYRNSETSPLVISRLNSLCVDILEMLEKEKETICNFANNYGFYECGCDYGKAEEYYNENFNTKEKFKLNSVPEEEVEANRPKSAPYLFDGSTT